MPVKKKTSVSSKTKTPSRAKVSKGKKEILTFEELFESILEDFDDAEIFHVSKSLVKNKLTNDRTNCGYQYRTESGKIISVWQSNRNKVVEPHPSRGKGWYRTLPGVTVSKDGGLIPPGSRRGSFFGDDE